LVVLTFLGVIVWTLLGVHLLSFRSTDTCRQLLREGHSADVCEQDSRAALLGPAGLTVLVGGWIVHLVYVVRLRPRRGRPAKSRLLRVGLGVSTLVAAFMLWGQSSFLERIDDPGFTSYCLSLLDTGRPLSDCMGYSHTPDRVIVGIGAAMTGASLVCMRLLRDRRSRSAPEMISRSRVAPS
jgi:hypothetical protein